MNAKLQHTVFIVTMREYGNWFDPGFLKGVCQYKSGGCIDYLTHYNRGLQLTLDLPGVAVMKSLFSFQFEKNQHLCYCILVFNSSNSYHNRYTELVIQP